MINTAVQPILADAGGGAHMGDYGGGMMWFGGLVMLAVLVLIVWAIVRGFDQTSGSVTPTTESATRILADRYARGEIDSDEYRERASELNT